MRIQLASNFYVDEFQTSQGELNLDTHHILILQAIRSWLGVELFISSGNRYPKWDAKEGRWGASAHDIYYTPQNSINETDRNALQNAGMLTLPATGSDVRVKELDSWQLMDKMEEFCNIAIDNSDFFLQYYIDNDIGVTLAEFTLPLISGRGVYPDSKSGFVHLDNGHNSQNPRIRAKRTEVTRWVRIKGVYHITRPGETFKQLRTRLEQ